MKKKTALLCTIALTLGRTAEAVPLACQPNAVQPMLPIYHIIGNVTVSADGNVTSLEPVNDASGVTFYGGLWHVWHQCCQNHWDHLISVDLVHWQRLPPPIQPLGLKTWDGSISLLPAADGGPVILYDAQDGKTGSHGQDPRGLGDKPILGLARPTDPADQYLVRRRPLRPTIPPCGERQSIDRSLIAWLAGAATKRLALCSRATFLGDLASCTCSTVFDSQPDDPTSTVLSMPCQPRPQNNSRPRRPDGVGARG